VNDDARPFPAVHPGGFNHPTWRRHQSPQSAGAQARSQKLPSGDDSMLTGCQGGHPSFTRRKHPPWRQDLTCR
jgi:hypothetical protein